MEAPTLCAAAFYHDMTKKTAAAVTPLVQGGEQGENSKNQPGAKSMFAAIREKLSSRNRGSNRSQPQRSRRLGIEALEERTLMTTSPLVFATIQEGAGDFGNTIGTARFASVAPMMETHVQGKVSSGADVDIFRVSLKQGQ